ISLARSLLGLSSFALAVVAAVAGCATVSATGSGAGVGAGVAAGAVVVALLLLFGSLVGAIMPGARKYCPKRYGSYASPSTDASNISWITLTSTSLGFLGKKSLRLCNPCVSIAAFSSSVIARSLRDHCDVE